MANKIGIVRLEGGSYELSSGKNGDRRAEYRAIGTPLYPTLEEAVQAAKALAARWHCAVDLNPEDC